VKTKPQIPVVEDIKYQAEGVDAVDERSKIIY
jgi:hypothetical protein